MPEIKNGGLNEAGLEAAIRECARITAPNVTDAIFAEARDSNSERYRNTREEIARVVSAYLTASMPEDVRELVERLLHDAETLDSLGKNDFSDAHRQAATALASLSAKVGELTRERNAALDRVEELEREAGDVASEFEGEITGAVFALLRRSGADMEDGYLAGEAVAWLDLHIREISDDNDKLRASLAERDRIIAEKDKALDELLAAYVEDHPFADDDDDPDCPLVARLARAARDRRAS